MIATTTKAKVYYLPAAQPAEVSAAVSRWTVLNRRLLRAWWRVRLSVSDFRLRSRRRHRADDYVALLQNVFVDGRAELVERRPSKPSRPATILDFHAARLRLRPQAT